jgi:dTDP-4-amino-4,6-dideoxygalactose transaminase
MAGAGVQTGVHYPRLVSDQSALRGTRFEVVGELARARVIANTEVSIPINPQLSDDELDIVIGAVNGWRAR